MTVLTIIGILFGASVLFLFITQVNVLTQKFYRYEFFNWTNYAQSAVGYALIYFGDQWHEEALLNSEDLLNGQLLILFGLALLFWVVRTNVKRTSFYVGFLLSLVQLALYAGLAIVGALALFMAAVALAQTKHLYNQN